MSCAIGAAKTLRSTVSSRAPYSKLLWNTSNRSLTFAKIPCSTIIHPHNVNHFQSPHPSLPILLKTFHTTSIPNKDETTTNTTSPTTSSSITDSQIIYEGALASLTTRLKRISLTSCIIGIIGLPTASYLVSMDTPIVTQAAVGGTALLAAVGSTVALHYCFSPYVHTLEYVLVPPTNTTTPTIMEKTSDDTEEEEKEKEKEKEDSNKKQFWIKATTRNLLTMKVETIFNPDTDVIHENINRPFCNFIAKGVPMYVHKELIQDEKLYKQLLGEDDDGAKEDNLTQSKQKDDDDLF